MREHVTTFAEWSAAGIEAVGIAVIVLVLVWTLFLAVVHAVAGREHGEIYRDARRRLARGILLGLEFLVAADIIHTVAVELTFESVGVLAIVVLIRTFLSFTLELESSGRWPWEKEGRPEHRHA
ncbi:MAG: DUF1622 domain-containing protein [Phycisphaerales bacterium JB060]